MTELERRLSAELRVQQQVFRQKLKQVTEDYQNSLKQIADAYTQQMSEAKRIIERQDRLLSRYERELNELGSKLGSVQVTLDESPLLEFDEQLTELKRQLGSLYIQLVKPGRR